jgi:hypothetical protein
MEKIHGTKKKGITGQIHNESLLPFSFFSVN